MSTKKQLTRRGLLANAGIGALLAACGDNTDETLGDAAARGDAGPDPDIDTKDVDVAVVGAGLAGLTAAWELHKAGHSVHVIEADVRVGGRIWTVRSEGGVAINWGAHFVGPQQARIRALASELGLTPYLTYNTGNNIQFLDGVRKTYTGLILDVDVEVLVQFQVASETLREMAATLDTARPWEAAGAEGWDSQTFFEWIRENVDNPVTRSLLDLAIVAILSVEPRDVSLLYMLFYIRSAGSLDALLNTADGAQESQFEGGTQQIPERIAERLGADALTLGSPVRRVVTTGEDTTVHSDKVTVVARRVIIAVPPPLIPRIVFEPGLSALKDQLCQRQPMGSVGKAVAIYETPFWRDDDLSGQVTSDRGPVKITFDISPESGQPGVMLGFVDGQDARLFADMQRDERKRMVLDQFVTWFGEKAAEPVEYMDMVWDALPLHRGGPVAVPTPGGIIGFGQALRRSEGPIHFASTETALEWAGYMDGAVQAGQLTAAAVAEEL